MKVIGFSGLNNSVSFKRRSFPNLPGRAYRIAQGFDAAAALVTKEGIQAAAAEERFTGEKTTGAFPINAIEYCLSASGIGLPDVDVVAHGFDYRPYQSLYQDSAYFRDQYREVYSREAQLNLLHQHFPSHGWDEKFVQVPHHLAHAASTFYVSGFDEALILVADGMGEMHSTTLALGCGSHIDILAQIPSAHSLGILYSVFTLYLGFDFNMDEYKVMGLAPYGNPRRYLNEMMDLINLQDDGLHSIPILFRNQTIEEKETYSATLTELADRFGPARDPGEEITQHHKDVAAALQVTLQTVLLHSLRYYKKETGQDNLCMAGGVALNCSANGLLRRSRTFKGLFVQPAAGDDGSALGAALYVQRQTDSEAWNGKMTLPLWGPSFSDEEICEAFETVEDCQVTHFESFGHISKVTAERLASGQVIGWFQGRMEFGPRALGSRSILADPRRPDMRDRINALVKKREAFRPFAPAVAAESAAQFFDIADRDAEVFAHMLFIAQVRKPYQDQLPAITHVDGTARVQTVSESHNGKFWRLLKDFETHSGMPVLLNTSFNVKGQPIVCSPQEAIETFLLARLDALVIGNYLVRIT